MWYKIVESPQQSARRFCVNHAVGTERPALLVVADYMDSYFRSIMFMRNI